MNHSKATWNPKIGYSKRSLLGTVLFNQPESTLGLGLRGGTSLTTRGFWKATFLLGKSAEQTSMVVGQRSPTGTKIAGLKPTFAQRIQVASLAWTRWPSIGCMLAGRFPVTVAGSEMFNKIALCFLSQRARKCSASCALQWGGGGEGPVRFCGLVRSECLLLRFAPSTLAPWRTYGLSVFSKLTLRIWFCCSTPVGFFRVRVRCWGCLKEKPKGNTRFRGSRILTQPHFTFRWLQTQPKSSRRGTIN